MNLLDIAIEVAGDLLPQFFEQHVGTFYEAIVHRGVTQEQLRMANNSSVGEGLSDQMYNDIIDISNGADMYGIDLVSTAIRTNNWINYALFYMISDEANIIPAAKDCRELVNAVSMLADFGKIYPSDGVINLYDYDASNPKRARGSKFLLREEDIKNRIMDPNFNQMMNIRKMKLMNRYVRKTPLSIGVDDEYFGDRTIDEDGYITPVFFNPTPIKMEIGDRKGNIDSILYGRLEDALAPLIEDANYTYRKDSSGCIKLIIQRDNSYGAYEEFIVDDGTIVGGSDIYILGSFINKGLPDNIFVSVKKHKDTAYKILNISFYNMTMYEVQMAANDLLSVPSVYNWVDFSNTSWMDRISYEDRNLLSSYLYNIEMFMRSDPNLIMLPRMRFNKFMDVNNFVLTSDCLVISPLENTGHTSKDICEGLAFTVANGVITQYFGGMPSVRGTILNPDPMGEEEQIIVGDESNDEN